MWMGPSGERMTWYNTMLRMKGRVRDEIYSHEHHFTKVTIPVPRYYIICGGFFVVSPAVKLATSKSLLGFERSVFK